jgi:hypothetical protein
MKYQIDQSGRVEFTSKPTVIAFSNGKNKAIYISAVEKRKKPETVVKYEDLLKWII